MGGFIGNFTTDAVLTTVQQLRPIADDPGSRSHSSHSRGCFAGPKSHRRSSARSRPEQLDDTTAASGVTLDEATLASIDDVLGAGGDG